MTITGSLLIGDITCVMGVCSYELEVSFSKESNTKILSGYKVRRTSESFSIRKSFIFSTKKLLQTLQYL